MVTASAKPSRRKKQNRRPSAIAVERRQDLQQAAVRSIAKNGYAGVTVAMICEEAGFSRGLIGHYFKGKEDLLLEAILGVSADVADANKKAVQSAGSDPFDRLHAVVKASFSPPGFMPDKVAVWVALVGSARWSPQLASIYKDLWRGYRVGIAKLIKKAAEERSVKLDHNLAALAFSQLMEGFWVGWAADPVSVSKVHAEQAMHLFVDSLFLDAGQKRK